MSNSWFVNSAVLIGISIFILLPIICVVYAFAVWTFRRYRHGTILRCPERGKGAQVTIDAMRAALSSIIGQPRLRVKNCSLWGDRKECMQTCVRTTCVGALSGPH